MGCKFCDLVYGLENPEKKVAFNTRHFIAFLENNPPPIKHISAHKEYLLAVYKKHKLGKTAEDEDAWNDLINKVLESAKEFLKKKYDTAQFSIETMDSDKQHYHFYIIPECRCVNCNSSVPKEGLK